jgi:hypothetical protein
MNEDGAVSVRRESSRIFFGGGRVLNETLSQK